jgi:hypothetical protein
VAVGASAGTASAWYGQCHGSYTVNIPYGSSIYTWNTSCAISNGGGYEIAQWNLGCCAADAPGNYLVQLTDNGYVMANHWTPSNPTTGHEYTSGWSYHPYWGTYCATVWAYQPGGRGGPWRQAAPSECIWSNGYQ